MPFSKNQQLTDQILADIKAWQTRRDVRGWHNIVRNTFDIAIDPDPLIDELSARLRFPREMVLDWGKGPPPPAPDTQRVVLAFIERYLTAP